MTEKMTENDMCPLEPEILSARREGRWNDAFANHLETCAACREADELATWMRHMAAMPVEKQPPDPEVIWAIAQISAQVSRGHTPWTFQTFKGIAVLAASAVIAVLGWPSIAGYVSVLVPPRAMHLVPVLASCVVASGLAVVAFTTCSLLKDE